HRQRGADVVACVPWVREESRADCDLRVGAETAQHDVQEGPDADRDEQQGDEVDARVAPLLRLVAALGGPGPQGRCAGGRRAHQLTPWVTAPRRSRRRTKRW